jgi:hypothetical protein
MKPSIRTKPRTHYADATYSTACILRAETSSTEPCGGDAGHGARAVLKLTDMASVCWTVTVTDHLGDETIIDCPMKVSLEVAGDCEQGVLLAALEQMVATMRAAGVTPEPLPEPDPTATDPLAALKALRAKKPVSN